MVTFGTKRLDADESVWKQWTGDTATTAEIHPQPSIFPQLQCSYGSSGLLKPLVLKSTEWGVYLGLTLWCPASLTLLSRLHRLLRRLSVHIQTCRALMVVSVLLGFIAIIVSVVGMKCTKVGDNNPATKGRIAVSGGALFLLAGAISAIVPLTHKTEC